MFGKLNHLAITTDHYTTLGMFYRGVLGMKVSGDTSREMSAISGGDGYVGMTLIPFHLADPDGTLNDVAEVQ